MNFISEQKVFAKSSNSSKKIVERYTILLSLCLLIKILLYFIFGYNNMAIVFIKNLLMGVLFAFVYTYILKIIKRKNMDYFSYNVNINLQMALIISFVSKILPVYILLIGLIISLIVREIYKDIGVSASLYGILFILIYSYLVNDMDSSLMDLKEVRYYIANIRSMINKEFILSNLVGTIYFSPVLAIVSFLYLFYKKSIKYSVVVSYGLIFLGMMLVYSIFKGMGIWFFIYVILTGNIFFFSVYILSDYMVTPVTNEGEIVYGIILGMVSFVGYFINPEVGIIISLMFGSLFLNKLIDRISFKLKYNLKYYYSLVSVMLVVALVILISLIVFI